MIGCSLGQLKIQRLVHGGHYASHQQSRNQILGSNPKLLRQVLYADSLSNGDRAGNGLRLVGKREARRRHKALHRAFFWPLGITLPRTPWRCSRTARGLARNRWRRQSWSYTLAPWKPHAGSARGMWPATLIAAGTVERWTSTRRTLATLHGARPLEDRLASHHASLRPPSRRTPGRGCALLYGPAWDRWRRVIDRPRTRLRGNHSPLRHDRLL